MQFCSFVGLGFCSYFYYVKRFWTIGNFYRMTMQFCRFRILLFLLCKALLDHWELALYKYCILYYIIIINPPTLQKITLACIACLCFEIGVCPQPDLSSLFQYTNPTPVVSLHLIPRIQYHPGIPVTLLTGSSSSISVLHSMITFNFWILICCTL